MWGEFIMEGAQGWSEQLTSRQSGNGRENALLVSYLPYKQVFRFIYYLVCVCTFAHLHVHPSMCVEVRRQPMESGPGDWAQVAMLGDRRLYLLSHPPHPWLSLLASFTHSRLPAHGMGWFTLRLSLLLSQSLLERCPAVRSSWPSKWTIPNTCQALIASFFRSCLRL